MACSVKTLIGNSNNNNNVNFNLNGLINGFKVEYLPTRYLTPSIAEIEYISINDKWIKNENIVFILQFLYYVNGVWMANGFYGGQVAGLYSIDGKTWNRNNTPVGLAFYDYSYINDIIIACTSAGLYYSLDGKTWTQSNITSGSFESICYSNEEWITGDTNGNLYGSKDGKNWQKKETSITSSIQIIEYDNNGTTVIGTSSGAYYNKITNQSTWTFSNLPKIDVREIIYNNYIWVLRGYSYNNDLYYSLDGITWTKSNIEGREIDSIYYADGVWVAGTMNKGLYYSIDGKTWTQTNITSEYNSYNIYYDNGLWVAGGNNMAYYSIDGKLWYKDNTTLDSFGTGYIYYANGLWFASGNNGTYYMEVPDIKISFNQDTRTWDINNTTKMTLTYTDNIIPDFKGAAYLRFVDKPNIWYLIHEITVNSSSDSSYNKTFSYTKKIITNTNNL